MNSQKTSRFMPVAIAALVATTGLLIAGPLNPPAGPIASTGKTTQEIYDKVGSSEPRIAISLANTPGDADSIYRIVQPGSYYLTGNVNGVNAKHGIEISANGVTLDLNGFEVIGVAGSLTGIYATTSGNKICNGRVHNWGGDGIGSQFLHDTIFQNLSARENAGAGFKTNAITGQSSFFNCTAYQNTLDGFLTGNASVINACTATFNTGKGFSIGTGCSMLNCTATGNTGKNIFAGANCTIDTCSVSDIETQYGCVVRNCSVMFSPGTGILTGYSCIISGCTVTSATGIGISVSQASTVTNCNVYNAGLDGIRITNGCYASSNTCVGSGNGAGTGAGIHAITSDNRIEGNNCTGADFGIDVDGAGNIIIRNTCSGNSTNWEFSANNIHGQIVDRTTPISSPVSGNSAASVIASTDPLANITY